MRRISEDAEALVRDCAAQAEPAEFPDLLVLGSGYGGAVAAARFAEQGHCVWLLERGQEYLAGEFPADLSQAPGHLRAESMQRQEVRASGYDQALFDFRIGDGAAALVGNGLGGGSLINAAVALHPDDRVFRQSEWPAALRDAKQWAPYFAQAEQGLGVQDAALQRQSPYCVPQHSLKRQRLEELAQAARDRATEKDVTVTLQDVPLAIEFRDRPPQELAPRASCIGCGNCVSGCNHNAKLSLDKTYLARARRDGARLFTGVTALWLEYSEDSRYPGRPWVVHCVRTSERKLWEEIADSNPALARKQCLFEVRAERVVVAAGTFGSSELLLRSRQKGLALPADSVGRYISANGDDLSAAYDLPVPAGGIGHEDATPPPADARTGPTISGVIQFKHGADVTRSTVTEDGGIPGLLRPVAEELLSSVGVLHQLTNWAQRHADAHDPLSVQPAAIRGSLALLGMGHDGANGVATLAAAHSRLAWCWQGQHGDTAPPLHRTRLKAAEDLGGMFLPNPASGLLPDELGKMLEQAATPSGWITVHPLGGCRMADDPTWGVVNDRCQVYRADGSVHPGLYVMDGSVVPRSLGVNPLLTITALAERACELALREAVVHRCAAPPTAACCAEASPAPPQADACTPSPPARMATGTSLNEVLRGRVTWDTDAVLAGAQDLVEALQLHQHRTGTTRAMALFLEMDIQDWGQLWTTRGHRTAVTPGTAEPVRHEGEFTRSRLVIDIPGLDRSSTWPITGGHVQVLRPLRADTFSRIFRFFRTVATYGLGRVLPDLDRTPASATSGGLTRLFGWLMICWHATATRGFIYELSVDAGGIPLRLRGEKFIDPAASWPALGRAFWHKLRTCKYSYVERRSVWDQLTQLDVELLPAQGNKVLASGRLDMDVPEMVRRVAPQLKTGPDLTHAMTAFLSYPTLILRHLLKGHVQDFRLPDYQANLPATDWALAPDDGRFELTADRYPRLTLADGRQVPPDAPLRLDVKLHAVPTAKQADNGGGPEMIRLGLVRYRQPTLRCDSSQGPRRYRAIILMNGFAQNTLPFVAPELGSQNLATLLYEQGWDVWLFEYRVSPLLRASARFSSMDDIAACDIPAAVDKVIEILDQETEAVAGNSQVFMFSHCVGSASLGMSLLGGHLHRATGPGKLAGVLFSQFQPFVIGSATAQMRLLIAPLLINVLGLDYVQFAAGTVQADIQHALLDRLFASFSYADTERCPHEQDLAHLQPDTTTCKRMAGLLSRLFRHDQLHLETHEQLDRYFGRTNLGVFLHGAKCVENERLVNADGQNVYVTDDNLRKYLDMPLMLLHGEDNVLFDKESLNESRDQIRRAFGTERLHQGYDRFTTVPEHAHFDCTIGKNAPQLVFPQVLDFFDAAFNAPDMGNVKSQRLRARLPLTGPIIGWTRRDGDRMLMRLWIEVDGGHADQAVEAMTVLDVDGERQVQFWPLMEHQLLTRATDQPSVRRNLIYALADLSWSAQARGTVRVGMVSLHTYNDGADPQTYYPASFSAFTEGGAAHGVFPMTLQEARDANGRTPWLANVASDLRLPADTPEWFVAAPLKSQDHPPKTITPLASNRPQKEAIALLRRLAVLLSDARKIALKAEPGTLSRSLRSVRTLREAWVCVGPQTWNDQSGEVRMLLATCRHPGLTPMELRRRDTQLQALARHQQEHPAAMMWMMGDQIYADASAGLADSPSPVERFLPKYREAFGSPGFRALARQLPLYMLMDDHEIDDNWSGDRLQAGQQQQLFFDNAHAAYKVFQQLHGPFHSTLSDAPLDWQQLAIYRLNTRLHRERAPSRQMLDAPQWTALEVWLLKQQATHRERPKFIASGSVVAPGLHSAAGDPSPRAGDTWQSCPDARRRLLEFIAEHRIQNVVFLSGDYHCSASATLVFPGGQLRAYALVCPALHAPTTFANVDPCDVIRSESVPISTGAVTIEATPYAGDGWLECTLRHVGPGSWQLDASFYCTPLGTTAALRHTVQWQL